MNAGAVTFGSETTGVTGYISAANSLVGSTSYDAVGSDGVTALSNGNYVVASSHWNNGSIYGVGAVTWCSGTTGVIGVVSSANSLVGSISGDTVGDGGVTALSNGNYVVDSSYWHNAAIANVGAVTLCDGTTGVNGVVSSANSLVGSTSGDHVGNGGITALSNGNYVVNSPDWSNGAFANAGAVTWGSGTTGVIGIVSDANSLVGSADYDSVGFDSVTALSNGNYVVDSSYWHNGSIANAGAVTWGSGTAGVTGAVSSANSLVGSTSGDNVGRDGVTSLSNGNYVIDSSNWNNGAVVKAGAVTFGNGLTGVMGVVNSANSLVGNTKNDQVGTGDVTALNNGNYIVNSSFWNGDLGAVTFGDGTTGISGAVSGQNSLIGMSASKNPGSIGIITDNSSGAVYANFPQDRSGHVYRGSIATGFSLVTTSGPSIAVTDSLGKVTNGNGTLSFGNTTVGAPLAQVITVTNNGTTQLIVQPVTVPAGFSVLNNFLPNQSIPAGSSTQFTLQLNAIATGSYSGVVTIADNDPSASPFRFNVSGTVTKNATLQFVDPHPKPGNQFGATVTALSNGNVVITAVNDDAGGGNTSSGTGAGAVYLYNGQTGALISTLTGSHAGDQIGYGTVYGLSGITALTNGNFVIDSPNWNGGIGAVTWASGATGVNGIVSAANSLVGAMPTDSVGGGIVTALSYGNYVVSSPSWNNGSMASAGAVTWGSGTTGVKGLISSTNSLVGSTSADSVGGGGVTALNNGNYVVDSPSWNNGSVAGTGAVTWGSGTTGVAGKVSSANSLVGSTEYDNVGYSVSALSNGNYVVDSPSWTNGSVAHVGAVTWGSGKTGVKGVVSSVNSLVGSTSGDSVGSDGVTKLSNGNYVVDSSFWNNGATSSAGAVTWGSGTNGVIGVVSSANSLVGSTPDDNVGDGGVTALSNGNYVVESSYWNNGLIAGAGAVTWGSGTTGVKGVVSSANSLVGSSPGDNVGLRGVTALSNGNYVVAIPSWNNGALARVGAVTWGSGTTGVAGAVSSANSLVGSTPGDRVGFDGITALGNGNYVVDSSSWNNGAISNAGAVTWGSGTTGVKGVVSAANSLVGSTFNDSVGGGGQPGGCHRAQQWQLCCGQLDLE